MVILGIYYKLQTFLYLPASGIVQGMRPVIGYNYGAGEYKRVRKIYLVTLAMSSVIMIAGTIICLAVPGQLMGLFTANETTVQAGKNSAPHYQRRVPCLRSFRHFLRRSGGTWKRNRFSCDIPLPLCDRHSSGRFPFKQDIRRCRSMERILDRRGGYSYSFLYDQQEEGLSLIYFSGGDDLPGIFQVYCNLKIHML